MRGAVGSEKPIGGRERLTEQLHQKYFAKMAYYHLVHAGKISDPDQRISSDVKTVTDSIHGWSPRWIHRHANRSSQTPST